VPEGGSPAILPTDEVWQFRDRLFGADGREVHMFWEATWLQSALLPGPTARDPLDPAWREPHVARSFTFPERPDRVTARVRLQPIGREVLESLVATGDLDRAYLDAMPTFTLGATELDWREEELRFCVP